MKHHKLLTLAIPRGNRGMVSLSDLAPLLRQIESIFSKLGAYACACCGTPMAERRSWDLFGCCHSCWMNCEDIGDRVCFDDVGDHDLAVAWIDAEYRRYLAGNWHVPEGNFGNMEPAEWLLTWSLLCAFGEERITKALSKHPRKLLFFDPSKLRFEKGLGLVPHGWRTETEPRTAMEWRAYWAQHRNEEAK